MTRRSLVLVLGLLLLATACTKKQPTLAAPSESPSPSASPTVVGPTIATSACPTPMQALVTDKKPGDAKPAIVVPDCGPPASLQILDLTEGTGAAATNSSMVTVNYVGVSWSTRQEFDSSFGGQPASFSLSSGLIQGWLQGIPGMKVGGRRQLVIPPDLGYGADGRDPIKPNETLVFIIDLKNVE